MPYSLQVMKQCYIIKAKERPKLNKVAQTRLLSSLRFYYINLRYQGKIALGQLEALALAIRGLKSRY